MESQPRRPQLESSKTHDILYETSKVKRNDLLVPKLRALRDKAAKLTWIWEYIQSHGVTNVHRSDVLSCKPLQPGNIHLGLEAELSQEHHCPRILWPIYGGHGPLHRRIFRCDLNTQAEKGKQKAPHSGDVTKCHGVVARNLTQSFFCWKVGWLTAFFFIMSKFVLRSQDGVQIVSCFSTS